MVLRKLISGLVKLQKRKVKKVERKQDQAVIDYQGKRAKYRAIKIIKEREINSGREPDPYINRRFEGAKKEREEAFKDLIKRRRKVKQEKNIENVNLNGKK